MTLTLHEAVKRLDVEAVRKRLESGTSPNELDLEGNPPLAYLFEQNGDVIGFIVTEEEDAIIKLLLGAGAEPSLKGVGRALMKDAWSRVSSALEAGEARYLAGLLRVNE